jgi:hypothetical protein
MKFARILMVCFLFACCVPAEAQESGKKILGIMPTFDISGDPFGQQFAQNLTAMVYEKLQDAPFQVMLLNPGGLSSPLMPESDAEYLQSSGASTLLVMTLQQTDKPQKGDYILHLEAKLVDPQGMKEVASSNYSGKISHNDALLDAAKVGVGYGSSTSNTMRQGWNLYSAMSRTNGSRPFEKQPLGKVALNMAASVRSQALAQMPATKADTPASVEGGACTVMVRVQYVAKKATSRAYDLIVNGENASLWQKDGVSTLENVKAGPLFLQVSVADPPYRLPVQDLYQANTVLDCARPERQLFLDIGPVGDALLHWR